MNWKNCIYRFIVRQKHVLFRDRECYCMNKRLLLRRLLSCQKRLIKKIEYLRKELLRMTQLKENTTNEKNLDIQEKICQETDP